MIRTRVFKIGILVFSLLIVLFIINYLLFNGVIGKTALPPKEESKIKLTIENFIKKDYNFNGGENDFSEVDSDVFKEYLRERNSLKAYNNKTDGYKPYDNSFKFKYDEIAKIGEMVRVKLEVEEKFLYDLPNEKRIESFVKNVYEVILHEDGEGYKILSASIDTDVDVVDAEFDVNEELGYDMDSMESIFKKDDNPSKEEQIKNLNKMKERISYLRSQIDDEGK